MSGDEAAARRPGRATALRALPGLEVERDGNVVSPAPTSGGAQRVVLAGHLDTVPIAGNLPSRRDGDVLHGCGTCDMKSGLAVMLRVAHLVGTGAIDPRVDLTWVCYDCEEVEAARNGLGRLARERPDALRGDLAILLEPTDGAVEGGCQGTLRVRVRVPGVRAHSARVVAGRERDPRGRRRCWRGWPPTSRAWSTSTGCTYREGLNAVAITGGVAGNVIPDECTVSPSTSASRPTAREADALAHVRDVLRRLRRSSSPTPRRAPGPGWTARGRRRSSPPSAARAAGQATAGPTSPASASSASRR